MRNAKLLTLWREFLQSEFEKTIKPTLEACEAFCQINTSTYEINVSRYKKQGEMGDVFAQMEIQFSGHLATEQAHICLRTHFNLFRYCEEYMFYKPNKLHRNKKIPKPKSLYQSIPNGDHLRLRYYLGRF
jgi:hypothetical protein